MEAKVYQTKCEESPIPKDSLEIQGGFKIEEEKKHFLWRLVDLIKETMRRQSQKHMKSLSTKKMGPAMKITLMMRI